LGEGFIVVDQTPSKLHRSAVANLSSRITHRLTAGEEIDSISASLSLGPDGKQELTGLERQEALALLGHEAYVRRVRINTMPDVEAEGEVTPPVHTGTGAAELMWCSSCPRPCHGPAGIVLADGLPNPHVGTNSPLDAVTAQLASEALDIAQGNHVVAYCAAAKRIAMTAQDQFAVDRTLPVLVRHIKRIYESRQTR
jgi:hypothetical protein